MGLHGRPAPGAATFGFALDMAKNFLDKKSKWSDRQKYYVRPITLSNDEILTNLFLRVNRGTMWMRIAVSCE